MSFNLVYSKKASKQLDRIDKKYSRIITLWLLKNIHGCKNPRLHGEPLEANHKGKWRYRIGSYRILVDIIDKELIVLALNVGHRKDIYEIR
ncbi:MAG: type II toxin-antitoxin system RelE/ParE family toxin [Coriobacteriia bacterium]|nr:type II toxin-antitoxin system RelE/ParE family toxin [Coriobacteriia bacterium]